MEYSETDLKPVNEGMRLLIRRHEAMKIAENIDRIAKENYGEGSLTDSLIALRDEERIVMLYYGLLL